MLGGTDVTGGSTGGVAPGVGGVAIGGWLTIGGSTGGEAPGVEGGTPTGGSTGGAVGTANVFQVKTLTRTLNKKAIASCCLCTRSCR